MKMYPEQVYRFTDSILVNNLLLTDLLTPFNLNCECFH